MGVGVGGGQNFVPAGYREVALVGRHDGNIRPTTRNSKGWRNAAYRGRIQDRANLRRIAVRV